MVKLSKTAYNRSLKYTETIILVLFALSAILMSLSQDKTSKAMEISLKNMENFEAQIIFDQGALRTSINHLIVCNDLEFTKYLNESPSPEMLTLIEKVKETCFNESVQDMLNASHNSLKWANYTFEYRDSTHNEFQGYQKDAKTFSKFAFWIFICGLILCFILIFDLMIFEPEN